MKKNIESVAARVRRRAVKSPAACGRALSICLTLMMLSLGATLAGERASDSRGAETRSAFAADGTGRPRPSGSSRAMTAILTETFDDVTTLSEKGWYIRNNSAPVGPVNWKQGNALEFSARSGDAKSYICTGFESGFNEATLSNWLISPPIALRNGDRISFWTRKSSPDAYADNLEVRLSVNGSSADVGPDENSVGDFQTLLTAVNPGFELGIYPVAWTKYTLEISGLPSPATGRVAFRYYVANAGPVGVNSEYIGIDTFQYLAARPESVEADARATVDSNPRAKKAPSS
jgi:hypothetical protein